jgi:hypothetical protein
MQVVLTLIKMPYFRGKAYVRKYAFKSAAIFCCLLQNAKQVYLNLYSAGKKIATS